MYLKPAAGWSGTLKENALLSASNGARFDNLGTRVAVDGSLIIGGAYSRGNGTGAATCSRLRQPAGRGP